MSETAFTQIDQQIAASQPATVLVERSNGDITTGQVVGLGQSGSRVFFGNLTTENVDGMGYRNLSSEELSDGHQEKLAEELAGVALRGTEADNTDETEKIQDNLYKDLLNGKVVDSVVDAAVPAEKTNVPPGPTSQRYGYWAKPSEAQIARAAEHGYDLTQQDKY